jgi:hypothetical protein
MNYLEWQLSRAAPNPFHVCRTFERTDSSELKTAHRKM